MPTSTPHMNGAPRSRLPIFNSSTSSSSPVNLKRTNDELRQHISRLKAELDVEKAKSRQIHRDKVADIKKLKDEYDKEKLLVQGSMVEKLKSEHESEIKRLKDTMQKEKEIEIKQILKFKDEELRTTKKMMSEDKEFSLREQDERFKREMSNRSKDANNDTEFKLRQELNECKRQKMQVEETLKQKSASEAEKSDIIKKLKEEHEKENQRVVRDARIQIARNVHELKSAQKALAEKEQEITRRELDLTRLEEQKEHLTEKIRTDQLESGVTRTDKERELYLKNAELKRNLDELAKKLALSEKESSTKRSDSKDSESSSRADHRVKELKKRNGELVNLAKKLEDKAKRLQEEVKELKSRDQSMKSLASDSHSSPVIETFKKSFTMQRARDLAENAKVLMAKDKEIAQLKEKITNLEDLLKQKEDDVTEVEKLEMVIHQIEKEKLKLEKQFADIMAEKEISGGTNNKDSDVLLEKLDSLETEKGDLEQQLASQNKRIELQHAKIGTLEEKAENLQEKADQCGNLLEVLKQRNEECDNMTQDLQLKELKIQELNSIVNDSERKRKEAEKENEKHVLMVGNLQNKLNEQSQKLVEMENLEREYKDLKDRLGEAENQCDVMHGQIEIFQDKIKTYKKIEQDLKDSEEKCKIWERDYDFAVDQINKRNKEITDLHEAQKNKKEAYDDEIDSLRAEISRLEEICVDLESKEADYKTMLEAQQVKVVKEVLKSCNHVYVQTSRPQTPVKTIVSDEPAVDVKNAIEVNTSTRDMEENWKRDDDSFIESEPEVSLKGDDDILDIAASRIAALAAMSSSEGEFSRDDQPNVEKLISDANLDGNKIDFKHVSEDAIPRPTADDAREIVSDNGDTSDELSLSLDEMSDDEHDQIPFNNNRLPIDSTRKSAEIEVIDDPAAKKRLEFQEKHGSDNSVFGPITPQGSVDSVIEKDRKPEAVSNKIDKLSVFIAKYTYDPFEHSPNDDPSLELALEAGDYVYVFGEADEDGFYTGELVNGQRGLVPSNFVEKIADESQLFPIENGHEAYPGDESDEDLTEVTWSVSPTESIIDRQEDTPLDAEYLKNTPRPTSAPVVSDIFKGETSGESEDEFFKKKGLSPPRKLKVERQLNNSIVISWLPPNDVADGEVQGYAIKADGQLKETVIGSEKTKAIVSDIQRDKVYRITVHCFDKDEKESPGSVAAITVGRGASAVPTDLRINNVTPLTADLEWACGNSSMLHAVYLDGKEIHVVKPGIDRFRLTNLVPDHEYEVSVEARPSSDAHKKPKIGAAASGGMIFRTIKGGPPEPPINVQAKVTRQSASHEQTSINVSWLPVTITENGDSNSPIVKGYTVYMNDSEAVFVDQPTADQVSVMASSLATVLEDSVVEFIELWVKTQSIFGESIISNVVVLPLDDALFQDIFKRKRQKDREPVGSKPRKSLTTVEAQNKNDTQKSVKEADVESDKGKEGNVEGRVKPTVVRYDVVDSDDSDESVEDDSDDEAPHIFDVMSDKAVTAKKDGEKMDISTEEASLKPSNENLILPKIPMPDYPNHNTQSDKNLDSAEIPVPDYPGTIEVKARNHFNLEDLLSSSDSELSAIEEETVEDLIEYNKDGSRSTSPQKQQSLSKSSGGKDHLSPETTNKTYSLHSEDEKNRTFELENKNGKRSDKTSEKTNNRTSKDALTFSSDDVMDLLDKDIVGGVPDLPFDADKERTINTDKDIGYEESVEVNSANAVPVTDLSDLSSDLPDETGGISTSVPEKTEIKRPDKIKSALKSDSVSVQPDVNDIDQGDDLPAKQAPAQTKDHENIDARPQRRKWSPNENISQVEQIEFAKGDVSSDFADTDDHDTSNSLGGAAFNVQGLRKGQSAKEDQLEDKLSNGVGLSSREPDAIRKVSNSEGNKSTEPAKGIRVETSGSKTLSGGKEITKSEEIAEKQPSMGQAVSSEQKDEPDLELDENDIEDGSLKIPLTSVHDLYTLNAVDSFDDSILDSEAEYKPYFTPSGIEENANREIQKSDNDSSDLAEQDGKSNIVVDSEGSLSKGPAMESIAFNETPMETGIHSTKPVPYSQDGQVKDNKMNRADEVSNRDTRTNHVEDEKQPNNVRVFVALFSYDPITMSPNTDGVDEELAFNEGDLIKVFGDCDEDGFYYGELDEKRGFVPSNMVQEVSLGDFGNSFNIPPPPSTEYSGDTEENISDQSQKEQQGSRRQSLSNSNARKDSSTSKGSRKESSRTKVEKKVKESNSDENKKSAKMDEIFTMIEGIDLEEKQRDYRYISERDSIYCLPPRRMIALYDYDPAISSPNVDSEVELPFNKGEILLIFGDMDEDGFFAAQNDGERGLVPSNFLEDCPEQSDSEEIEINMGAASPRIKTSSRKSSTASVSGASPVDSPKTKKKKGILAKGKKIFSKLKGK